MPVLQANHVLLLTSNATRGELIDTVSPLPDRMKPWQLLWRLTVLAAAVAALALLDPQRLGTNIVLRLPLLAIVPMLAMEPVVMPAGALVLGRVVELFLPGPGLLAARSASKDKCR